MADKDKYRWYIPPDFINMLSIPVIITILAAILFPMFTRARESARKSECLCNLIEIGNAISTYTHDYNGLLPSSILVSGNKTWNEDDFIRFASEKRTLPLSNNTKAQTWPELIYPYCKDTSKYQCPSDPDDRLSYYWKAAVDRAWYGGYRKLKDFKSPANQIIVFERKGWHHSDAARGLADGVKINCLFMDSHVASKSIRNSGYAENDDSSSPLPKNGGEPAWFNHEISNKTANKNASNGQHWDPSKWEDSLE
jgi:general secretion pathway protein G